MRLIFPRRAPRSSTRLSCLAILAMLPVLTGVSTCGTGADQDQDGWQTPDDCDDTDASTYPGAAEQCDGRDNDCDGLIDEGFTTEGTYYPDLDGDGFGRSGATRKDDVIACAETTGYVAARGDCDDTDPAIHPGAVDPAGDQIDGDCGGSDAPEPHVGLSAGSRPSIQEALDAATDGSTVWVGPGTWPVVGVSFRGRMLLLEATHPASDTILDAGGQGRVMFFQGEPAGTSVRGFTLTGGVSADRGGGVLVEGSSVAFTDCIFRANRTSVHGGGLYAVDASIVITGCRFEDNVADHAEEYDTSGGAVALVGSTAEVRDSAFLRNSGFEGGGLFADSADVSVTGSRFEANYAIYGGALHSYASTLRIEGCTIRDNEVWQDGGGIHLTSNTSATVSNTTVIGNCACGPYYPVGGGIFLSGDAVLENLRVEENGARVGGGIFLTYSNARVLHSRVSRNESAEGGGGIWVNHSSSPLIEGVIIDRNLNDGLYLYVPYTNVPMVRHCAIVGNTGSGVVVDDYYVPYARPLIEDNIIAYSSVWNLETTEQTDPVVEFNVLYATGDAHNHNLPLLDPSNQIVEPGFQAYDEAGLPSDFHLALASEVIDSASPGDTDPDGSRADPGAYGGETSDEWDLDGDGWPQHFWPGTLYDAPAGFDPAEFDCNDLDPEVHGCM